MNAQSYLKELFLKGLEECSPGSAVKEAISLEGSVLHIKGQPFELTDRPLYLLAVGKAAVPMYEAVYEVLGKKVTESLVITSDPEQAESCGAGKVIAASHPTPDASSLKAGESAMNFVEEVPKDGMLVTLISGGTSSLMCYPAEGISIEELNRTFELLNNSGATIYEINTVRKHCSRIKGGQLLRRLKPSVPLVDLVISDVPGDDLSIIGSGPTVPDESTFQDAYHILLEYELWERLPDSVRVHIEKGITGEVPETLKEKDQQPEKHYSHIISSARMLAKRMAEIAERDGIESRVADSAYNEDVEAVAARIADEVMSDSGVNSEKPKLFLFYGESTVSVTGSGKGGRNQELALRGALKIAGRENITWLSAGTDGIDGPTDAAGAIVDGSTISKAKGKGLEPESFLKNNDSYHFHKQMGTLLKTGPTGNNLMDVVMVLVSSRE